MSYVPVKGAHLSGRWNRSPRRLAAQLQRAANRGATWLTLTEVADGKRPRAVALPGWSKAQGGRPAHRFDLGECAVLVRDDVWKIVRWRAYVIGPDPGPGNRVVMVMALLEHLDSGATMLLSTAHLPSDVEPHWDDLRGDQWRQAVHRWRRINASWRRAYHPTAEATTADWNVDYHRPWVRRELQTLWPGLRTPPELPRGGTFHRRLIDLVRTRGVAQVHLAIRSSWGASDHRELWVRLLIRRPG